MGQDGDRAARSPVPARPVAAVVVDSGLAHLDRLFEYSVPDALDEPAQPGVRVRVRFAGRELDGFVVQRRDRAGHAGPLTPIRRVVSPEPVLTEAVLALARATADRYAGVLGDVLRLAIPKRHAGAERALPILPPDTAAPEAPEPGPWAAYPAGASFLRRIADGGAPAAAWLALPGRAPEADWPAALAVAAATALAHGRGALLVVPDHRDVERVDGALNAVLGRGHHVRLTADRGPQARYTAWLKVLRGHARVVVGTRAAMFAPVRDLGLVAWWDDGDDLLAEPRAPYPHVREVLAIRAEQSGAALLAAAYTRSVEVADLVRRGRLAEVGAPRAVVRAAAARVVVAGEGSPGRDGPARVSRVPPEAWQAVTTGLVHGPVLVQVPRAGYLPALACQACREPLTCPRCGSVVQTPAAGELPRCSACSTSGQPVRPACPACGSTTWRSVVVGARRTAEELGRGFPGTAVHTSAAGGVLASVGPGPALVIATPGSEPPADGGYAAALLLDAGAVVDRPGLDASVEALRRWCAAAALVRPRGLVVVAGAVAGLRSVETLVRWDPAWLADRELDERRSLGLPPAVSMVEVTGPRRAVGRLVAAVAEQVVVEALGPLPLGRVDGEGGEQVQVLLRAARHDAQRLAHCLVSIRAVRSARKDPDPVTIRVDGAGTAR